MARETAEIEGPHGPMTTRRPQIVLRGARVLTLDAAGTEHRAADIVIDDGVITAVGPGAASEYPAAPRRHRRHRLLAIPGMVNTHFHSPGNFLKGAVPSLPLELFMLYEVPPFMAEPVSGRYAYLRTMLGAIDMLKQGVTAVHDDAYYLPVATRDEISAVFGAYRDAGIRATVTIDQPNVVEYEKHAFFADRLPPDVRAAMDAAPRQDDAELLRLYDWMLGHVARRRRAAGCARP